MREITIKRNGNGDSRTAKTIPNVEEFMKANRMHIHDVSEAMTSIGVEMIHRGGNHDHTKIRYEHMFYHDLCETMKGNMKFEDGKWAKIHYLSERHHLSRYVPEDVNLIDVIEMIADCVCAGMARSGEVRPLEIDESILTEAMRNTAKLIEDSIVLVGGEE